ncbi:MAG: IS200/IS605 family element transposase accessory protein TnpB [Candidatus Helarchaeota archaeon]|nr:IS200/IS605 family element transposase accessory protein TnpB [Candidatus Helarchaeota archaeon]
MVVLEVKKRGKIQPKGSKMSTADQKCAKPLHPRHKQLKLINDKIDRTWDRKRIADQVYFVATCHQFRVKDLRQFCKFKKIKIPQARSRKEEIVKLIWENGADFQDIHDFASQADSQPSENTMLLTERVQVKTTTQLHALFQLSKNLYNKANCLVHAGFQRHVLWNAPAVQKAGCRVYYPEMDRELQGSGEYRALPAKTSQKILQQVDTAWTSYFEAIKAWKKDCLLPKTQRKFRSKPHKPGWKGEECENLLFFTNQQCKIKENYLHFPKAVGIPPVKVNATRIGPLQQVRILPRGYYSIVEIVFKKSYRGAERVAQTKNNLPQRIVAIDLGVRNLVCLVTNIPGVRPVVVKGGVVKSINQYYNKQRAHYQQQYEHLGIRGTPRRLARLTRKRNNKIEDIFHKLSQDIIEYCQALRVGTIIMGYNPRWKQNCSMGKRNNQNFVTIPFHSLVQKITYKAKLAGIKVEQVEESHTSKCSFLDDEPIAHHDTYLGQRGVYRSKKEGGNGKISYGLFKTAKGQIVNADVNGGYNILRKAFPEFTKDGIEGLGLIPVAVKFSKKDQDFTGLKQLANLASPLHALPKAGAVDGTEVGGVSTGGGSSKSIKIYTK